MTASDKFWAAFIVAVAFAVFFLLSVDYSSYSEDVAAVFWRGIAGGIWFMMFLDQLKTINGWRKKGCKNDSVSQADSSS